MKYEASASMPTAAASSTQDALDLLRADHQRADAMLADCERLAGNHDASAADRSGLVSRLGALLIAHAQMEQQLFYPVLGLNAAQLEQVTAEHAAVEASLQGLSDPEADAAAFTSRIAALAQQVRAHVKTEEAEYFPKAGAAGIDLHALGTQMALRRGELLGDQGID
ncbi:MAG: hemerythrin domain-containing protein [Burkholderiaceae bacterium]